MAEEFDIVIVGAGLVGSSVAIALSQLPLKLALVESHPLEVTTEYSHYGRVLALTYASSRILQSLLNGVRPPAEFDLGSDPRSNSAGGLTPFDGTPIEMVHVSDRGHFGKVRIHAKDEKVPALGYVVRAEMLGNALIKKLLETNLKLFNPANVSEIKKNENGFELTIKTSEHKEKKIQTRLVIAADGTNSAIRKHCEIPVETEEYHQSALSTIVETSHANHHVAYERFIEKGALAILPISSFQNGLVWTGDSDQIEALKSLSDDDFLKKAQTVFGFRLGRFLKVSQRFVYPLKKVFVKNSVMPGLALLGNAAHTVHPIAAQGFNLGLNDAAILAEMIENAVKENQDFADLKILNQYQTHSETRQKEIIKFTDSLIHLFGNNFLPLNCARNTAMLACDFIPPIKKGLARKLMGLKGRLTKLARGISE